MNESDGIITAITQKTKAISELPVASVSKRGYVWSYWSDYDFLLPCK